MKDLLRNRLIFLVAGWDSGLRYARLAGGLLLFVLLSASAVGQNMGDYRTIQDGNWLALSTWERDDSTSGYTLTIDGHSIQPDEIFDFNAHTSGTSIIHLNGKQPNPKQTT